MQAINSVNKPFFVPQQMLSPEAGIILACQKLHKEGRTSTNLKWLRAHKDVNRRNEDLPPHVRININMDKSCMSERTSNRVINRNNNKFNTPYPRSGAMLIINGKWAITKYASC